MKFKSWLDPRFRWNPVQYDNVTDITLEVQKIWVPGIVQLIN